MSKMSDLMLSIEEDLINTNLDHGQIAQRHSVPIAWVYEVSDELMSDDEAWYQETPEDRYLPVSGYEGRYDF